MTGRTKGILSLVFIGACVAAAASGFEARSRQAPPAESISGSDLYRTYCAVCHGRSGKGDGPLAANMKTRPPDLTLFAQNNGGTFPAALVTRIIDGRNPMPGHGGRDMPIWADAFKASRGGLSEEEVNVRIEAVVKHLESIQQKSAERRGEPMQQLARF
jgi:mono/diheme cytochrome c family protein